MTADEARELTRQATAVDERQVSAVLAQWDTAIDRAARDGHRGVRSGQLPAIRMPVSAAARKAAEVQLTNMGFKVETVAAGPNEADTEVSW